MTREEAIWQIENRWSIMDYGESEALGQALYMAIEALQDRPTDEWCTDCKEYDQENHNCPRFRYVIARTVEELKAEGRPIVIRAKTFMRKDDFDKWAEDIKKQNENIICIPCNAEVTDGRPHGEWQRTEDTTNNAKCSNCNKVVLDYDYVIARQKYYGEYNYCPNCGARMKGGAE